MTKYKFYDLYDSFFIDLLFSYENISSIFNYSNPYFKKVANFMPNIENLQISNLQKDFIKKIYTIHQLCNKNYMKSYSYINHINDITGPNISKDNMSFFTKEDIDKTLLLYEGGGLGDKIMFARFIEQLSKDYIQNKIILLLNDKLVFLFTQIFNDITNLEIISYQEKHTINHFDYHCSLVSLIKYMNIEYSNIPFKPLFQNIQYPISKNSQKIISELSCIKRKKYIFNWKGNPKNHHELNNRKMELIHAISLFNLTNIHWIVITKDITKEELDLLEKYNIPYYGNLIDQGDNCFEDSVHIMRNVDGLISTDTSLVHLSANLNVPTYVLLTTGCEWRWTKNDTTTNWYPDSILIRQKNRGNWKSVIDTLVSKLS